MGKEDLDASDAIVAKTSIGETRVVHSCNSYSNQRFAFVTLHAIVRNLDVQGATFGLKVSNACVKISKIFIVTDWKKRAIIIKQTWMVGWIRKCWFDDDAVTGWKQFFNDNAETFVGNRDDFPVYVFFSVNVNAAPVFVTLPRARDFPIGNLAFFRAVSPLLAAAAKFHRKCCDNLEAEGTVPRNF